MSGWWTAILASVLAANAEQRPNVVIIVADDMGFRDFGFMGSKVVKTPNIDRLASQSYVFPNAYVVNSLCRPSLVSILTGQYPHQHRVHFNDPPDGTDRRLGEMFIHEAPALPRLLATAGYRSFQTGKFWEGKPENAGFTEGMSHGDPSRSEKHPGLGKLAGRHGDLGLKIGRDSMQPIAEFLDKNAGEPVFVWYAPMMPHTPFNPPEKYVAMYQSGGFHPKVAQYYAMCTWFDDTVGELMAMLEQRKMVDNTLVVFCVDNGWETNIDPSSKQPFTARSKRSPFELGSRSPTMFRWPGKIQPTKNAELASSIDIAPTILAAANVAPPSNEELPGVNLLPAMMGRQPYQRDAVFGEVFEHTASQLGDPAKDLQYRWVRSGTHKFIDAEASVGGSDMLFDLSSDPEEKNNLNADPKHGADVERLRRLLDETWTVKRG